MADDIRFYDFDLNLLYILPAYAVDSGYISINVTKEYNSDGALEIVYVDNSLKRIITANKDNIVVVWHGFQGFITGYKNEQTQCRILGMSLNGLLHRVVIPKQTETIDNIETIARTAITNYAPWLSLGRIKGFTKAEAHSTDKYMQGDEYIQQLMNTDNGGYMISADIENKQFIFECLKPDMNPLMLSENNLNAYNFETTYTNKEIAYGGWYEKEQDEGEAVWTYITLDSERDGIYQIDVVLDASTETTAKNELLRCKAEYDISAKVRGVNYGTDYQLGDIIRVQQENLTERKLINGVNMWQETSYGEEPILTEYKEETNE